jgi:hypothetical protein
MSTNTANTLNAPSPAQDEVVIVEETSQTSPDSDQARRRRRRRRRRSVRNETTALRMRLFLLVTVVLLIFVALTGSQFRQSVRGIVDSVRHIIPVAAIKSFFRLEIFALVLAVLVIIYLMPGVEERVLRALGLKKERRSSRR